MVPDGCCHTIWTKEYRGWKKLDGCSIVEDTMIDVLPIESTNWQKAIISPNTTLVFDQGVVLWENPRTNGEEQ
jgi:hypothetical protein